MKQTLSLLLILLLFCFARCRKDRPDSNGLPPATQQGKNTLGFLLNGQPWTPKGFNGTANLSVSYDPNHRGGTFNISAYRIIDQASNRFQSVIIAADSIQTPVVIQFGEKNFVMVYQDVTNPNCRMDSRNGNVSATGFCKVTKVDKAAGILAGEFEVAFTQAGCEKIEITKGRFDMKY